MAPHRPKKGHEGAGDTDPAITPTYEGPEVLTALLARAGSPLAAEEVAKRFEEAQAAGASRAAAIPALFPKEPHFAGPQDALRLYANLFGLWDRVLAGLGSTDDAPAVSEPLAEPAPEPLPPRGAQEDATLAPELVEAMWKHLAALPEREARRLRDRFENVQPDLVAWLDTVPLPESGALAAHDLAFEAWAMLDHALAERLGAAAYKDLAALQREPPALDTEQPALAAYVAEQLDNLADEDSEFGEEERAQVEKVLATALAALGRALKTA